MFWQSQISLSIRRVNVCEHSNIGAMWQSCGTIFTLFSQTFTLFWLRKTFVIVKTSVKLPCVYVCLSSGDLFMFPVTDSVCYFLSIDKILPLILDHADILAELCSFWMPLHNLLKVEVFLTRYSAFESFILEFLIKNKGKK